MKCIAYSELYLNHGMFSVLERKYFRNFLSQFLKDNFVERIEKDIGICNKEKEKRLERVNNNVDVFSKAIIEVINNIALHSREETIKADAYCTIRTEIFEDMISIFLSDYGPGLDKKEFLKLLKLKRSGLSLLDPEYGLVDGAELVPTTKGTCIKLVKNI